MPQRESYNPLEKLHLAESIVRAILGSSVLPLSDTTSVTGAGVYIIYYTGSFRPYAPIAKKNKNDNFQQPIYIGKAIPKGGRKGGLGADSSKSIALRDRLNQHRDSVSEVTNLDLEDFHFRSLVVDDIWIPLGENMLIEKYKPVWNLVIDGFGNKDPGRRRKDQHRSPWDVLHPGRKFAEKLGQHPKSAEEFISDISEYLRAGKLPKRKKIATVADNEDENSDET